MHLYKQSKMSQVVEEYTEKLNYDSHESSTNFEKSQLSMYCCTEQRLIQQRHKMVNHSIESERTIFQANQKWKHRSAIVHILVMIFGTSAWIGVNGIFIQLPLLVNSLPESWGLAAYLVVIIQAANIAPIIYSLMRKSSFKMYESYCILIMLGIGSVVMGLMAFMYDVTFSLAGKQHSIALFILTFFSAAVSCTSSVLFMPYLRNFKEIYLVSYFIGEGLSGVLPSIVALIQGIGESSSCVNITNSTEIIDNTAASPRFSSKHYFLFIFGCLVLSLIAFLLLDNIKFIKKEEVYQKQFDNNYSRSKSESCHCQKQISVLPQSSIPENDAVEKSIYVGSYKKTDSENYSNVQLTQKKSQITVKNLYLYILLSLICLLANGLLPGIQPYSCLSYGNMSYHLSATFSQIANPTACLLALWYLPNSKKIINWLTLVIFILSDYIIYLALISPDPPLKNSKFGKALVILSWVLLVGLISYVKLIITSVFRRKSEIKLFHVGAVMQVGSACGAVLSFILINYTNLLHEYTLCKSSNN